MTRWTIPRLLSILLLSLSAVSASSPTSFCKCTCFGNSNIIPLDTSTPAHHPAAQLLARNGGRRNCADCNRQFCLDYNLPICKSAKEEDVFTTCFQRDSRKDEAVVFIFIFSTAGLLVYAAAKPLLERWRAAARQRSTYAPVLAEGGA